MERFLLAACLCMVAAPASAGALRPGDFVMVTSAPGYSYRVVSIEPGSMALIEVVIGGYVSWNSDIAVNHQGKVLITSPTSGIVRIDPISGQQTLFAPLDSLGIGTPAGLTIAEGGDIYVTMSGAWPRVIRLSSSGSLMSVVTSAGLLGSPEGLAFGRDGALYVCEVQSPVVDDLARGSLVRVDPASGAQTRIAAGAPLYRPHDLAVAPDGALWSIGYGIPNGHLRYVVRTVVADGSSYAVLGNYANGIAIRADGVTLIGNCDEAHLSCNAPYTYVYPSGPYLWSYNGSLAVVPEIATPATSTSWGRIKALYR